MRWPVARFNVSSIKHLNLIAPSVPASARLACEHLQVRTARQSFDPAINFFWAPAARGKRIDGATAEARQDAAQVQAARVFGDARDSTAMSWVSWMSYLIS
jgi:hypothetical protein